MSSAHDAPGASAHAHDVHDDQHAFDGEPARELSPGEPRSPNWLPVVGVALFSLVGVYMLSGGDGPAAALTPPRPLPVEAAPAPAPPPAPPPAATATARSAPAQYPVPPLGDVAPAGSGVRKLSPDQVEQLKKRIEEARSKGQLPARPPEKKR
jgi:hypothetical protein